MLPIGANYTTNGGGVGYGSAWVPLTPGGGGGAGSGMDGQGGSGGGVVRVRVRGGVLSIDSSSRISADGQSTLLNSTALQGDYVLMDASDNGWAGYRGGAGAGGSVWVAVSNSSRLQGSGVIRADGGRTCPALDCTVSLAHPAGAGAGGRVRVETGMFVGRLFPSSQPTSRPSAPSSQPTRAPTNPTGQPSRQPSRQVGAFH